MDDPRRDLLGWQFGSRQVRPRRNESTVEEVFYKGPVGYILVCGRDIGSRRKGGKKRQTIGSIN